MKDERSLAAINMHAILRNIEDLCELDEESRQIIAGKNLSIKFNVPSIESLLLNFHDGNCKASKGAGKAQLNLRLSSPAHLNQMVDGKKNPLPTSGFGKLGFMMKEFKLLAERLTYYLRPDLKRIESDPDFRQKSTILTAYTVFYALAEIANLDPIGQACAKRISDGAVNIQVENSIGLHVLAKSYRLSTHKGLHPNPMAIMSFANLDIAGGILRGTEDSYACIGRGSLSIRGRIPMVDNLNKILGLVAYYLA